MDGGVFSPSSGCYNEGRSQTMGPECTTEAAVTAAPAKSKWASLRQLSVDPPCTYKRKILQKINSTVTKSVSRTIMKSSFSMDMTGCPFQLPLQVIRRCSGLPQRVRWPLPPYSVPIRRVLLPCPVSSSFVPLLLSSVLSNQTLYLQLHYTE